MPRFDTPVIARTLFTAALAAGAATARGTGDPIFDTPVFYGFTHETRAVAGDFDEDGDLDLFMAKPPARDGFGNLLNHGRYTLYRHNVNQHSLDFTPVLLDDQHGGLALAVGDVNADGHLDVVSSNLTEGQGNGTNVLIGHGDGTFDTAVSYGGNAEHAQAIALGDMDNDGDLDMVLPNGERVYLNHGDGTFYTNFIGSDVESGDDIALGDFDEDGNLDIIVDDESPTPGRILYQRNSGNGNGDPEQAREIPMGGEAPVQVYARDLDRDGHLDLLTLNVVSADIRVARGNGDGTFQTARAFPTSTADSHAPMYMQLGDFDGDGYLDAIVVDTVYGDAEHHRETSVMLQNPDTGDFEIAQVATHFSDDFENIVAADLDGDGDIDVATATHYMLNMTGGCAADFNGDGAVDTQDVLAFLNAWNAGDSSADINADGVIDTQDVLAYLNLWNAGC